MRARRRCHESRGRFQPPILFRRSGEGVSLRRRPAPSGRRLLGLQPSGGVFAGSGFGPGGARPCTRKRPAGATPRAWWVSCGAGRGARPRPAGRIADGSFLPLLRQRRGPGPGPARLPARNGALPHLPPGAGCPGSSSAPVNPPPFGAAIRGSAGDGAPAASSPPRPGKGRAASSPASAHHGPGAFSSGAFFQRSGQAGLCLGA